jgi:Predicted membrane protein (DUF2142)
MSLTIDTTHTIDPRGSFRDGHTTLPCRRKNRFKRATPLLVIVLLALWSLAGMSVVRQGIHTALRPVATCRTEMQILDGVSCIARGEPLYPPIVGLPLAYHLYNPLTYLPAGWIGRWFELDLDGLLIAGRFVSLASMTVLLMLVGWYVRRVTASAWIAALAPAMVLYFHSSTLTDFFRNRPETLAILLSLAGWMLAQFRPRGWTMLCAAAFVAAMACKPTFVAAPLAIVLQLVCERRFRALIAVFATSLLMGLAVIAGSYLVLGEGYFEHTVWAMMSNPMDVVSCSIWFPLLTQLHWGSLLPATCCAVVWLHRRGGNSPILIYLAVCLLITTVAHSKVGADLNYHGELSLLMVLTTLTALGIMCATGARAAVALLTCLVLGTGCTMIAQGPMWNQLSLNRLFPFPEAGSKLDAIPDVSEYVARYAAYRGRALILDDEIAVRLGEPEVYDWFGLTFLFSSGHVDFDVLGSAVRDRKYAVIVLSPLPDNEWTCRLRDAALASGYRLTRHDDRVEEYSRDDIDL